MKPFLIAALLNDACSNVIDQRRDTLRTESVIDIDHRDIRRAGVQHTWQRRHAGKGAAPSVGRSTRGDLRGSQEVFF